MSISLSNADTPRAATTATSTGTDVGATCTSVVGDMVIDMVEYGKATSGTRTASVDGGQTQVLMGWTLANSDIWGSIAAAVPYVSSFTPTATTIF